jgi:hypothetical protein
MQIDNDTLYWLAGLLDGEASFQALPSPHRSITPRISIHMRDLDVIERVGDLWNTKPITVPAKKSHWSTTYFVSIAGLRGALMMQQLYPLMGLRRKGQIEKVFAKYIPPDPAVNNFTKLTPQQVQIIKQRIANGETAKEIAPDFGVTHYNIWAIREGKTWAHVSVDGIDPAHPTQPTLELDHTAEVDYQSIHWLAGLLEGEGSFLKGAPSAPNTPSIAVSMTDEDVIERVARYFGVKYHAVGKRQEHHKTPYTVHLKGAKAHDLMRQLYPLMGLRRREQIDRALENYVYNPLKIIDEDTVREIKRRIVSGDSLIDISRTMKVSYTIVKNIKRGRSWKHVTL